MAGVDIGTAYLTVAPSAKGFAGKLQSELGGPMASAGAQAGDQAGKGFGSRFKAGVATAAKAGALGLAAALGVGIAFARGAVAEARESQKVGATTAAIIKSTGGAAKITADQIGALSTAISNKSGIDDEAIQSGANLLLTFKNVRNEVGKGANIFDRATQAATDLSAAGFGDMAGASKMLGKALNDPTKGITALGRAGVQFTDQQKAQIKTLVDSGKTLEAQKIILGEVESQVGGVAAASATMGEKLKVSFDNFKEQVGTALLPVIDKVEGVLVNKVIPAVSQFFTEMQNGTGKGGAFVRFLHSAGDAAGAFFGWIHDSLWPALKEGYATIMPALKGALATVAGAFKGPGKEGGSFKDVLKKVGDVIANVVIPFVANLIRVYLPAAAAQLRVVITAVKGLWSAFTTWRGIVSSVISFVLKKFADLSSMWATVLQALSHVPGFGWAADAAKKLQNAADKANNVARAIDNIERDVTIRVGFQQTGRITLPDGKKVNVGMRAKGGPVKAGHPYVVGEKRPELFVPDRNGTIVPSVPTSGGAPGKSLVIAGNVGYDPAGIFTEWDKAERLDAALHPVFGG